jgi:Protein of unknown function (DUF4238)
VETDEKPRDSALVENLMTRVDNRAAPVLAKLVRKEQITPQERLDFAYFVAFMYLRVPAFRDFSQQMRETMMKQSFKAATLDDEWFDDLVRWMEESKGEKMPDDVREEIRQMYLDEDSYSLTWGKEHAISHLPQADDWSQTIARMRWTLHQAPEHKPFVTSDNPFVMVSAIDPNQISGLRKRDVSLTFPLHRHRPNSQRLNLHGTARASVGAAARLPVYPGRVRTRRRVRWPPGAAWSRRGKELIPGGADRDCDASWPQEQIGRAWRTATFGRYARWIDGQSQ